VGVVQITAFELAQRFVGLKEVAGPMSDPQVLAMLQLDAKWPTDDAVPWCSGFVNYIAWLLRLPRSKSLAARSWLTVGLPIALDDAIVGFDVVVLARGASVTAGHVAFFAGHERDAQTNANLAHVQLLGGNQANAVCVEPFPATSVLGVRRLLA
jgi:uncharacterized protein (TIGR02594 family)